MNRRKRNQEKSYKKLYEAEKKTNKALQARLKESEKQASEMAWRALLLLFMLPMKWEEKPICNCGKKNSEE